MKITQLTAIPVLILVTATLYGDDDTNTGWTGFSLSELTTSSNSVFDVLDADDNGSITLDEIDLIDEDPEQELSEEELASVRQRIRLVSAYFWTEEEINVFEVGDTNGDGLMNQQEFDNIESTVRTHTLELGLKALDRDDNGSVEVKEFSAHLENFEEWDTNGNGTIDRDEVAAVTDRRLRVQIRLRWTERELRGIEEETRRRVIAERELQRALIEQERAKSQSED